MAQATQSYQSHAKFVPLYHFVTLPILLVNVLMMGWNVVGSPSLTSAWALLMAIALFLAALFGRVFALKVQDRVIRLEERLRLRELLPAELKGRVNEFTAEQLIAIRFASDAEVADLAAVVLRENPAKRDAVKKLIKSWRADDARA
jgi:hypothetical protein